MADYCQESYDLFTRYLKKLASESLETTLLNAEVLSAGKSGQVFIKVPLPPLYKFRYSFWGSGVGQGRQREKTIKPGESEKSEQLSKTPEESEPENKKRDGFKEEGPPSLEGLEPFPKPGQMVSKDGFIKEESEESREGNRRKSITPGQAAGAGTAPAQDHALVRISTQDLLESLYQKLQLPPLKIESKKKKKIFRERSFIRRGLSKTGSPEHFARRETAREFIWQKNLPASLRYYRMDPKPEKKRAAVLVIIQDISGSIDEEKQILIRTLHFILANALRKQYPDLIMTFILQEAQSWQADEKAMLQIFHRQQTVKSQGGTIFASAYNLLLKEIFPKYLPRNYDYFIVQTSDGDNADTKEALDLVGEILKEVSFFFFVETRPIYEYEYGDSPWFSVQDGGRSIYFHEALAVRFPQHPCLVSVQIFDQEGLGRFLK